MNKTLEGLWNGTALIPDEPLDIPPGTRARIRIEEIVTDLPTKEPSGRLPTLQDQADSAANVED
jgi:hypothetical protein